jgi:hypothetical protein
MHAKMAFFFVSAMFWPCLDILGVQKQSIIGMDVDQNWIIGASRRQVFNYFGIKIVGSHLITFWHCLDQRKYVFWGALTEIQELIGLRHHYQTAFSKFEFLVI